jgi:hypothetical protein
MVEDAFRQAIGAGQGWLMRADDLRELQPLCVTENCRQQILFMMQTADTMIRLLNDTGEFELAQYRLTSLRSLEEMLARYPRGTVFVVDRGQNAGANANAVLAELSTFGASHGLSISPR